MKRRAESTVAPLSRLQRASKEQITEGSPPFRQQARVAPRVTPVPLLAAFARNPFSKLHYSAFPLLRRVKNNPQA